MDLINSIVNVFLFLLGVIGLWRIYRIAKHREESKPPPLYGVRPK